MRFSDFSTATFDVLTESTVFCIPLSPIIMAGMTLRRPRTYLRTNRLLWALSQEELGELMGLSHDAISKYELEQRPLSVTVILASEIVFGKRADELFPTLYKAIQDELGKRALEMLERLEGKEDKESNRKRELLGGIPGRTREIPDV